MMQVSTVRTQPRLRHEQRGGTTRKQILALSAAPWSENQLQPAGGSHVQRQQTWVQLRVKHLHVENCGGRCFLSLSSNPY